MASKNSLKDALAKHNLFLYVIYTTWQIHQVSMSIFAIDTRTRCLKNKEGRLYVQ